MSGPLAPAPTPVALFGTDRPARLLAFRQPERLLVALEAGEEMVVGYRYRMPGLPCGAWLAPRERAAPRSAPAD